MMEPLRSDIPSEGYLEGVKEIVRANDALLIFDEVSCGWRTRIGGIQEFTGVTPDMSVFAKSMSNGYAMGVVVGSRDSMELASRMFISSSYWSDNVGLAASLATINELKRVDSPTQFEKHGEKMRAAMQGAIDSSGVAASISGWHFRCVVNFDLPDESMRPKVTTLFIQEMARRGRPHIRQLHADAGPHGRGHPADGGGGPRTLSRSLTGRSRASSTTCSRWTRSGSPSGGSSRRQQRRSSYEREPST